MISLKYLSCMLLCLTAFKCCGSDSLARIEEDAKEWLKHLLKDRKMAAGIKEEGTSQPDKPLSKCQQYGEHQLNANNDVVIFMSSDLPDQIWVDLSEHLYKLEGTFILRGIPDNSFKKLAEKIFKLKKLGVKCPIQVDPRLFSLYDVNEVPCLVIKQGELFDKVSGNVSLDFALDLIAQKGDNKEFASILKSKLKEESNP